MIAFHNQFIIYEYSTGALKNESIMKCNTALGAGLKSRQNVKAAQSAAFTFNTK
jgi:hypothetical protein